MTINIFTIVWNEEFMLPHFLKHYSQFADRIFVIDDHSTDLTAQIAKDHPMVSYSEYGFDGLDEDEFNDTFESFYKIYPSDWVMIVDADEFISHLDMRNYLASQSGILKTEGYMMIGKTGRLRDCKPVRMKTFDKPVVFEGGLDVKLGRGRHTVSPSPHKSQLQLLHYKYPSREYYYAHNSQAYPRIMNEQQTEYRLKRGLAWYDRHIS